MVPVKFIQPISILILYFSGIEEDLEDNVKTVATLTEALQSRGHVVHSFEVNAKNWRKAVQMPGDVVFNLVEDYNWVLWSKVALELERMEKSQVGLGMRGIRYSLRKSLIKKRMREYNLATPKFRIFNRRSRINVRGLEYPLIVKPSNGHAGIGISQDSVVIDQIELTERVKYLFANFPGEVVVEEFVEGREIHVTVLGNENKLAVLPPAELIFTGEFADNWEVYTYEAKWKKDSWEYWNAPVVPAKLDEELRSRITRLAKKTFKVFYCQDVVRFDMRIDKKGNPYIVDINMSPGLIKNDEDATYISALAAKWSYEDLIESIVGIAHKRVYGNLHSVITL